MAKIKVRAGKAAVEQAQSGGDFGDPPKPGLYHLKLMKVEQKANKDGKGKHLSFRWQPVGVGREGAKPEEKLGSVWDRVSLTSEDAEWSRARVALALGAKPNRAGNVDLDIELDETKPGSPVGIICLGRVASDTDLEGNYRPKLGWIGVNEAAPEDSEAFDDEEEAEDEEEATEDFEEEEEGELLTEADLEEYDNKGLAALLTDFDLDKNALTVKVKGKVNVPKTRAKMIAAILEAQGAEEDEDGGDEDPF